MEVYMDKRYLLIIGIVIVCMVNLYFISNSSDVVGSASVVVDNYTFSLPPNFEVLDNYQDHVSLNNSKSGLYVVVYHLYSKNAYDNYLKDFDNLKRDNNSVILSNGSINIKNCSVSAVYYQVGNNDDFKNRSLFFFKMYGDSFRITMDNVNNKSETIEVLELIVSSIRYNYKK